jgi:hypothetical protein
MPETCTVTLVLDYDSLDCYLTAGHAGPHKGKGEHSDYWWDIARRLIRDNAEVLRRLQ